METFAALMQLRICQIVFHHERHGGGWPKNERFQLSLFEELVSG